MSVHGEDATTRPGAELSQAQLTHIANFMKQLSPEQLRFVAAFMEALSSYREAKQGATGHGVRCLASGMWAAPEMLAGDCLETTEELFRVLVEVRGEELGLAWPWA